jgi:hypothetical protein
MAKNGAQVDLNNITIRDVIAAIKRVQPSRNADTLALSNTMTKREIVSSFNQSIFDMFEEISKFLKKYNFSGDADMASYKSLFEKATKANACLPIEKFTMSILVFAPEFYDEKEDFFLELKIPHLQVNTDTGFDVIKSELFRNLWKSMITEDKYVLRDRIMNVVLYAHCYFYKLIS